MNETARIYGDQIFWCFCSIGGCHRELYYCSMHNLVSLFKNLNKKTLCVFNAAQFNGVSLVVCMKMFSAVSHAEMLKAQTKNLTHIVIINVIVPIIRILINASSKNQLRSSLYRSITIYCMAEGNELWQG